jgi:hypothetical protein
MKIMSTNRPFSESSTEQKPLSSWLAKLVDEMVASMQTNYIHFDNDGKTEEYWKNILTEKFKLSFAEFDTEDKMIEIYKNQFKINPNIYFLSESTITQEYVDKNLKDESAIILNGQGKQRFIYCVIGVITENRQNFRHFLYYSK